MKKKNDYLPEHDYLSIDDYLNTGRVEYLVVVMNPCSDRIFNRHKWSEVEFSSFITEIDDIRECHHIVKCSKCGEVQKRIGYIRISNLSPY